MLTAFFLAPSDFAVSRRRGLSHNRSSSRDESANLAEISGVRRTALLRSERTLSERDPVPRCVVRDLPPRLAFAT